MIRDSLSDIEFGHRLGMKAVFLEVPPEHQKPWAHIAAEVADLRGPSLLHTVKTLVADQA
jgi:histidinol phosphatase-like enzyme